MVPRIWLVQAALAGAAKSQVSIKKMTFNSPSPIVGTMSGSTCRNGFLPGKDSEV